MTISRPRRLIHQLLESRRLLASLAADTSVILPPVGSDAQPVAAFIAELPGASNGALTMMGPENMAPLGSMQMHVTSPALLALVPLAEADAVAVNSGNWSNPATWQSGQQPIAGGKALIAEGVHVTFDAQMTQPLKWLRVSGQLSWRTDINTTMMVETLVVTAEGSIEIGTASQPIQPTVVAEILIDTTGGAIDRVADPTLLGRGFISHGTTEIHGAVKTSRATSQADIAAGQTVLILQGAITGWRVGDTLLIPGTSTDRTLNVNQYDQADATNSRFHDDVVTIAAINGSSVTLQSGTAWAHVRPVGETFTADELSLYVINLTRNIVVRSSDATVPNQQRGHVMIMHNPDADIAYAQFKDLGRSDKRLIVDDPVTNFGGSLGNGNNPRGRYGLHLHMIGATSYDGPAAELTGNVVWGTPGWGIVQHDSHAVLQDNVVFDVVGAGIVAENGNEIGEWIGNTVVKITGDLVNNFDDDVFFHTQRGPRFDLGFAGSGYWVQGGGFGLLLQDNVAASINGAGFDIVHYDGGKYLERLPVSLIYDPAVRQRYIDAGFTTFTPNNVPMRGMSGVEVYNAYRGIHTWYHNRDSEDLEGGFTFGIKTAHDVKSVISDYTIWGVNNGVQSFYTSLVRYENGLVVGNIDSPVTFGSGNQGNNSKGIGISHNKDDSSRIDFDGLRVEGFQYGFQTFIPYNKYSQSLNPNSVSSLDHATFAHVSTAFVSTSDTDFPAAFSQLFAVDHVSTVGVVGSAATPVFTNHSRGGLSMSFDATVQTDNVAYMWDFDDDGQFDDGVGASVIHTFLTPGTYTVGLKVWDSSARMATTTLTIVVSEQPTGNVLLDPNFSGPAKKNSARDVGWIARDFLIQNNTAVNHPANTWGQGVIYQTITDANRLTGSLEFQFDYRRISTQWGARMMVSVFGADSYFCINQNEIKEIPIYTEGILETIHSQQFVQTNMPPTNQGQWQSVVFNFDVSQGFKYYFVRFGFEGHKVQNGDSVGVRNVVLAPASLPVVPAMAGQFAPSVLSLETGPDDRSASLQQTTADRSSAIDESTLPAGYFSLSQGDEFDAVHTQPDTLDDARRRVDWSLFDDWLNELEEDGILMPLSV